MYIRIYVHLCGRPSGAIIPRSSRRPSAIRGLLLLLLLLVMIIIIIRLQTSNNTTSLDEGADGAPTSLACHRRVRPAESGAVVWA